MTSRSAARSTSARTATTRPTTRPTTGSSASPSTADQAAIAEIPARLVKAWATSDAAAFADLFIEDGTMILPGVYQKGRKDIQAFMTAAFAGPYRGTQVTGTPIEIKPLAPGAVAMITEGGVIAAGQDELSDRAAIRASWILVNREGAWRLAVYQNCSRDSQPR